MGNIIRNMIEILIVSAIIVMGISTGLLIMNDGDSTVEFIVSNQTYTTDESMDFSSISIDSSFIKFNDTGFYIDSDNDLNIIVSYIRSEIHSATDGDKIVSFSAETSSGSVWFNMSGFSAGTSYLVKKDSVDFTTVVANASGFISFSNNQWSKHDFDIHQDGDSNSLPNAPSDPSPADLAIDVVADTMLSWACTDPDGDSLSFDVYFDTTNPPVSKQASNISENSFNPGSLSYDETYYWTIRAWDEHGAKQDGDLWSFSTIASVDDEPPVISNEAVVFSDPIDTVIGWVNISCDVSDDVAVDLVMLNISYPNGSTDNISLIDAGDGVYYFNTTFSAPGIYDYFFFAEDTNGNTVVSTPISFTMYANWDINMDGVCDILDLLSVSNKFGLSGPPGWIREDVNNDGEVRVLDLVILDSYLNETYEVEP